MKKLRPYAYTLIDYHDKYIGTRESLVSIVKLAKEKNYFSPNLVKIYANIPDGSQIRLPRDYYTKKSKDERSFSKIEFLENPKLVSAEKCVFKILNLKNRECWNCGIKLDFQDFCTSNQEMNKSRAIELWNNDRIEFYCCSCYKALRSDVETRQRSQEIQRNREEIFNQLPANEKFKIKTLEDEINMEIPAVYELRSEFYPKSIGFIYKNDQISGLSLYYYDLEKIPQTIRAFEALEFLDLSGNKLSTLPDWIKDFENLKYLNLLANKLKNLPDEIGDLKNLEYLNLSFNNLKTLPDTISNLSNLKTLYLWANKIENITDLIIEFKSKGIYVIM